MSDRKFPWREILRVEAPKMVLAHRLIAEPADTRTHDAVVMGFVDDPAGWTPGDSLDAALWWCLDEVESLAADLVAFAADRAPREGRCRCGSAMRYYAIVGNEVNPCVILRPLNDDVVAEIPVDPLAMAAFLRHVGARHDVSHVGLLDFMTTVYCPDWDMPD
ncbi:MAG: hypothetical protein ACSLE3_10220 [Microbacteriaceae bacterium]